MATILTVHGTFASGPEEGEKWWQRGSQCCANVNELVEAEEGPLKVEPFIWDGLNSESSRQAGAAKLLDRMTELEKAGEPYCVVGHSHGGSVISAALLRAAFYKRPLDKLSRWITIGTPFIDAQGSRLMLLRLGTAGKTIALSIWTASLGYFAISESLTDPQTAGFRWLILALMALFVVVVSWPILWLLARNRLYWHRSKIQGRARQAFASRWLSLRHEDDEAVQGLGAFQSIKHPIFARDFAVGALKKTAVVVVPLIITISLIYLSKVNPTVKTALEQAAPAHTGQASPPAPKPELPAQQPQTNQAPASPNPSSPGGKPQDADSSKWVLLGVWLLTVLEVLILPLALGAFVGVTLAIVYLWNLTAKPTSRALSYGMNKLTWSQLRANSLGSDIDGETGRHARAGPVWLEDTSRPLPAALATEIHTVSNAAAANSIAKFRAALSELSFYRLDDGGRDALNAFLCGEELIHTTYFNIPRFRKLLAYSIAQSPGFRPTAALRNDPDFPLIEQWYRELIAPATTTVTATATPQAHGAAPVVLQPN